MSWAFQILMRFDTAKQEIRSTDKEWKVEWAAGVPSLAPLSRQVGQGQINKVQYRATFGRDEQGKLVMRSQGEFSTGELKSPLQHVVTGAGWVWRAVAFGRL